MYVEEWIPQNWASDPRLIIDLDDSSGGDTDANGQELIYSIIDGNQNNLFSIERDNGKIKLADNKFLDYETTQTHDLLIQASNASSTDTASVAITVTDESEFAPTTDVLGTIYVDSISGQPSHITGGIPEPNAQSWVAVPLDEGRFVQFGFSGSGSLDRSDGITIKEIRNDFNHVVTAPNSDFVTFAAPYASTFYLLLEGSATGTYNLGVSGDGTPHTGIPT